MISTHQSCSKEGGSNSEAGAHRQRWRGALLALAWGCATWGASNVARAQGTQPAAPASGAATVDVDEPRKPVIVPPKLLYTPPVRPLPVAATSTAEPTAEPDAPTGDAATGEQTAASEVLLKVTISKDGAVSDAEVVTSGGPELDARALSDVKQFVFTPAQRDGVAIPAVISYLYRLDAVEGTDDGVGVATELEPAANTGILEGRLLIAGPDVPLAGTLVRITDSVGAVREAYTDADGRFVAVDLLPGEYAVNAESAGFHSLSVTEMVVAGEATSVVYRVAEVSEGIEVVVVGEKLPREVTRRTLERREITKVPGTGGDALRAIQSLPGVARPPALAGLLIVRGSSPQDTNYFFDGALVPIVYHFGGLSSVVPTEMLDRLDFYPGNFSTRFGRVTGGAIDVGLRSPNTSCNADYGRKLPEGEDPKDCYHGLIQADLIDTRVLVQGPIAKDWSFAIGGRRSWVDAWLKPALESAGAGVTTAPVYYDYQAFVEYRPNPRQKLRFQFYGSSDALEVLINNPSAQEAAFSGSLQFSTAFYRGQVVYQHQLTKDVELNTTVAFGRDKLGFGIGPLQFDLDSYPVTLRTEFGWNLLRGLKLNTGIDMWAGSFDVFVRAPMPPPEGQPDPGPTTGKPLLETADSGEIFRPGWYAEAEVTPSQRVLLVPGVRVDYARDSGHADIGPRLTGRYLLRGAANDLDAEGNKARKTALKGGLGYFYKPPEFQETNAVFGTPNLQSNRALHASVGVEQELTDQLELSVEGYYKDLDRQVVAGMAGGYSNLGTGRVIGAETLLKYKPDSRFFGWIAYTISKSTRRNGPGQEEYHFQFDQTHNLIMLGSYRLGDGWEIGARFRVVSGNMGTPVSRFPSPASLYAGDPGSYAPLQGKLNSERLPLFHQLDVRLERSWQFADWRMLAYLDVWNAYNNAAVEAYQYNFDFSSRAPQTGLPILPSLGLRGEF